jgi:hypothetical protein
MLISLISSLANHETTLKSPEFRLTDQLWFATATAERMDADLQQTSASVAATRLKDPTAVLASLATLERMAIAIGVPLTPGQLLDKLPAPIALPIPWVPLELHHLLLVFVNLDSLGPMVVLVLVQPALAAPAVLVLGLTQLLESLSLSTAWLLLLLWSVLLFSNK